ncbi:MAG: HAMP domain-containing protein [Acidobacteria bacterium]|nr:HAMP domain-containing protein [Acidobacteriota bacterium]
MAEEGRAVYRRASQFAVFKGLRNKLLALTITLSLVPLVGVSVFAFFIGSRQIAEDRIKLSLEKMAQDTSDKIDLMLRGTNDEMAAMATTFPLIYPTLEYADRDDMSRLLNNYCFNYDIFDLLLVIDRRGRIFASNTLDRYGTPLFAGGQNRIIGRNILDYTEEGAAFRKSIAGQSSHHDWYRSRLAQELYDYENEDVSYQYNIVFSEPIRSPETSELVGVWMGIVNWIYIQNILDGVEEDLRNLNMRSGYAFMYAGDADLIIGHKYRGAGRDGSSAGPPAPEIGNLYGTLLVRDHGLQNLHDAIIRQERSFAYEFPRGNAKISGLAHIDDTDFKWIVGVGIDGNDIFRPINDMTWWLAGVTILLASLVVVFTFITAHGITVPLNNLIGTARSMAEGNLSQRVEIKSSDEVGVLGAAFNDMARALSAREEQLQELNKNLEGIVRQRTQELEKSNEALRRAYMELQNAQEQLIHTEKMASLGQLVAGIAHEIKNPLNFIYGNTGFLADYTRKLQGLLHSYEQLQSISEEDRLRMENKKSEMNYGFIREDLPTLIDNFTEGASRINNIVMDLRTFSRMDADTISEIDVHATLEMSLNLLRNQYKDRVEIHREYGEVPRIQGYAGKLSQVFMNLLSNAFQAVPDRGDVWIRTRAGDGFVEVEVRDNGIGIPRENLKRIFEPFFTTKPVGHGTGLGLSISYGIVEQHHGRIAVSPVEPRGTTFTVHLPIFQERSST